MSVDYEPSAEMRLAERERERLGIAPHAAQRWITHDVPYLVDRPAIGPRTVNALAWTVKATPDRDLVAGVLLTIAVGIENLGERRIESVHLALVTSPGLTFRAGSLRVDDRIESDALAEALVAEGVTLEPLAPRARRTYVARFTVESGAGDFTVLPHVRAHRAPVLGASGLRLQRRAGESSFRRELAREREDELPFFELDGEEALVYEAADAAISSPGADDGARLVDPAPTAPEPAGGPTAPSFVNRANPSDAEAMISPSRPEAETANSAVNDVSTSPAAAPIDPRWHRFVVPQILGRATPPPGEVLDGPAALPDERAQIDEAALEGIARGIDPVTHSGAVVASGSARGIVGRGGPILVTGIGRPRLRTLKQMFIRDRSLGTIAHYILWLALAAVEPIDAHGDRSLVTFARLQERRLLRALVERKLGRDVASLAVAPPARFVADIVTGPVERERVARPGEITLYRAYRQREIEQTLTASEGATAFSDVAQMYGAWCASAIALEESGARRATEIALARYHTAMSIEHNRLAAHVRAGGSADPFVSTSADFDDRARGLLDRIDDLLPIVE